GVARFRESRGSLQRSRRAERGHGRRACPAFPGRRQGREAPQARFAAEGARVIGAVAQGDLSKTMALDVDGRPLEGEFLRTAKTINKMVEQLGNFSAEVTRRSEEHTSELQSHLNLVCRL